MTRGCCVGSCDGARRQSHRRRDLLRFLLFHHRRCAKLPPSCGVGARLEWRRRRGLIVAVSDTRQPSQNQTRFFSRFLAHFAFFFSELNRHSLCTRTARVRIMTTIDRGRLDDAVLIDIKRARGCVVNFDASLKAPSPSPHIITAETLWGRVALRLTGVLNLSSTQVAHNPIIIFKEDGVIDVVCHLFPHSTSYFQQFLHAKKYETHSSIPRVLYRGLGLGTVDTQVRFSSRNALREDRKAAERWDIR